LRVLSSQREKTLNQTWSQRATEKAPEKREVGCTLSSASLSSKKEAPPELTHLKKRGKGKRGGKGDAQPKLKGAITAHKKKDGIPVIPRSQKAQKAQKRRTQKLMHAFQKERRRICAPSRWAEDLNKPPSKKEDQ